MANFYTDVVMKDPRFHTTQAVSDIMLLEPVTRAAVQAIMAESAASGIPLIAYETYRSQERQMALFQKGVTQLRTVGVHHYGLACDLVKDIGGPSWKGDFTFLRDLAKAHGLIWGGDWGFPKRPTKFVDAVHVQRCTVARQTSLFNGDWFPDDTYNPYADLGAGGQ